MAEFKIDSQSGGTISLQYVNHRFNGIQYYLEIDQSTNIKNAQDSAGLVLTHGEIISLRDALTLWLETLEKSS